MPNLESDMLTTRPTRLACVVERSGRQEFIVIGLEKVLSTGVCASVESELFTL